MSRDPLTDLREAAQRARKRAEAARAATAGREWASHVIAEWERDAHENAADATVIERALPVLQLLFEYIDAAPRAGVEKFKLLDRLCAAVDTFQRDSTMLAEETAMRTTKSGAGLFATC